MTDSYGGYRAQLVETLRAKGINDLAVLKAVAEVPRHMFVPQGVRHRAYEDSPLPIAQGQTISQPYVQATYLQALGLKGDEKVLEVGTGSGYQTAILSLIAREVCSIERIEALSAAAEVVLTEIPTGRIRLKAGDGSAGWPYYAPFDKIIVSAATAERPAELLSQLAGNGCLIAPVQDVEEQLVLYRRRGDEFEEQKLSRCSFVPLLKGVG